MFQQILILFCIFFECILGEEAGRCNDKYCQLPNCLCSPSLPYINGKIPQLIALSFDESFFMDNPFVRDIFAKKNPDGCSISGTFFVSHEGTKYNIVNYVYNQGHEVASYSVTKEKSFKYWLNATPKLIAKEMGNQRTIISKFANISADKIQGARIPYFQMNGDDTYSGLRDAGFLYDNSWVTLSKYPLFPYTLDFRSKQPCLNGYCPRMSYPGFWIIPFNNWRGMDGKECDVEHCVIRDVSQIIFDWMIKHFNESYNGRREPINLLINENWFTEIADSSEALEMFFKYISNLNDVYIVSNNKVLEWIKHPVSADEYLSCDVNFEPTSCNYTKCVYSNKDGTIRSMVSCVPCPDEYPTLDNPEGKKEEPQIKELKFKKKRAKAENLVNKLESDFWPTGREQKNVKPIIAPPERKVIKYN